MSGRGYHPGLYGQLRMYAELVDDVLVSLKGGTSAACEQDRIRLADFLDALGPNTAADLPTRLVAAAIREHVMREGLDWSTIGQAIRHERVDAGVIDSLERLAWSLEHEQIVAMARIRRSLA
jgi:hypothetical protein